MRATRKPRPKGKSKARGSSTRTKQAKKKRKPAATPASPPPGGPTPNLRPEIQSWYNPTAQELPQRDRRGRNAALLSSTGDSGPLFPPYPDPAARATLTISQAERDTIGRLLDAIRPAFENVLSFAAELDAARLEGIGQNQAPVLTVEHVTVGIDAVNVFRTEISAERPRREVIRLCWTVIKWTAAAIGAVVSTAILGFTSGVSSKLGEMVATEILPTLEPHVRDLMAHVLPLLQ
jgi:hypothetical protein